MKGSWSNLQYNPGICLVGLRKTMKNLTQAIHPMLNKKVKLLPCLSNLTQKWMVCVCGGKAPFIFNLDTWYMRHMWVISFIFWPLYPWGKSPHTHWIQSLMYPSSVTDSQYQMCSKSLQYFQRWSTNKISPLRIHFIPFVQKCRNIVDNNSIHTKCTSMYVCTIFARTTIALA